MIAVIQRVKKAEIRNLPNTEIERGLVVFVAFEKEDNFEKFEKFINKILNLRVFEDENNKMNLSLKDISGQLLLVSNFTIAGSLEKGNRPSFDRALEVEKAREFFEKLKQEFLKHYQNIRFGEFQAYMEVEIINDGPVTLIYRI
ncbi:MAG: D-aminoacyl-tRNA deacylase [candidate division WOR-3 bacterium]